jgi:hypothetical protein
LAEATADPDRYRTKLFGPPRRAQGSPYFHGLRNAIFNLHKPGWTVVEAKAYLERALEKQPNESRKAEALDQFAWYVEEIQSSGRQVFRTRLNVDVCFPSWVPESFSSSGEVAQLDLAQPSGYVAWRFASGDARGWRQELRMPLIQEAVARELDAPTDEVAVGVYAFGNRVVEHTIYSTSEIEATRSSLEAVLRRLLL